MGDYLRITRVYLRGPTVAVWCFLFFCLLMVSFGAQELARNHDGLLAGVLSRKSYLAMFAYFNACLLGVLLRDNIAHPWASVLPYYRQKHLLITTLIALVFLGIPMFSMAFVGTSDVTLSSVVVIFLACLAAGLWTLHHPAGGFLAFPFLTFAMTSSSSTPVLADFLAGRSPVASVLLAFMSLAALCVFARQLLVLNEDQLEYANARLWGDFLRGRTINTADYLTAVPANTRATLQNVDPSKSWFANLKQVDDLAGYCERSLWQRLQLWRLGTSPTRTSVSVVQLMLPTFICIPLFVWVGISARDAVVIFSVQVMANPAILWLFWFTRRHRLGYESLRPRTRQEFVRELGLTLLWDVIQCWLGGVLFMGIAAAILAPELLQLKNIFLFVFCTAVGQLCAYAMMGIWLLKRGMGMVASILCAFCPFLAMVTWINFIAMNESIALEVNIAIASVLAVVSVATIALAYRQWCRADFD